MLLKVLSSMKYLLQQGLAIRGHQESDGNLNQLLQLRSEDDPCLGRWLKGTSPQIINELITLLGSALLQELLTKIHASMWFSVLAQMRLLIQQTKNTILYQSAGLMNSMKSMKISLVLCMCLI